MLKLESIKVLWKRCCQLQILARECGDMAVAAAEQETFEIPE